ncbi:MAG TPA: hypothetical protein ENJ93_07710 [Chloroflexi bacterium]|nr:hypothetical protein [Chloroflexota bacterium]
MTVIRRGKRTAVLKGEVIFAHGYRISIQERLSLDFGTVEIEFYGYELWHNAEKIAWYDAQPHPNNPALASTHPHHKHIPPDIKHNRIPAPNMSFIQPNLSALVEEIQKLIAQSNA